MLTRNAATVADSNSTFEEKRVANAASVLSRAEAHVLRYSDDMRAIAAKPITDQHRALVQEALDFAKIVHARAKLEHERAHAELAAFRVTKSALGAPSTTSTSTSIASIASSAGSGSIPKSFTGNENGMNASIGPL